MGTEMIDQRTLTKWRMALAAEDCVKVKELCTKENGLLNLGWEADGQQFVELQDAVTENPTGELHSEARRKYVRREADGQAWVKFQDASTKSPRTALHVAARRGDVELVDKILGMSRDGANDASDRDHQCSESTNCHLLKFVDGGYGLDALAMAVVNGSHDIVNLLKRASLRCNSGKLSNPYNIGYLEEEEKLEDEKTRDTVVGKTVTESDLKSGLLARDYEQFVSALAKVTEENLVKLGESRTKIEELYKQDSDFNFLPMRVYLFHFTFSDFTFSEASSKDLEDLVQPIREGIFAHFLSEKSSIMKDLLSRLWDGQGRTALHVAVDSDSKVDKFLKNVPDKRAELDDIFLNATDSVGRTPLYRAAATRKFQALKDLLVDRRTKVQEIVKYDVHRWGRDLDIDRLSRNNHFKSDCVCIPKKKLRSKGFNVESTAEGGPGPFMKPLLDVSSTALHAAIILEHEGIVKHLLENYPSVAAEHDSTPPNNADAQSGSGHGKKFQTDNNCFRLFTWPVIDDENKYFFRSCVSPLQLSVLVGNSKILRLLLRDEKTKVNEQEKMKIYAPSAEKIFPSFLLAAAIGNPDAIKAFLDHGQDPLVKGEREGESSSTALHYALKGRYVKFHPHMVDFVGCNHVFAWRLENDDHVSAWVVQPQAESVHTNPSAKAVENQKKSEIDKRYGQRKGSINLLLQSGINVWTRDNKDRTARPQSDAPEEFVTWWYDKVAEHTQKVQEKLSAAANAISVTAALVATASYLGPFTPPLGYGADAVQVNILAVRIFVVCNSLSLYLALAAIMYALVPSLSMPQESMFKELRKTRILVAIALVFLLPSIIFVLIAFAASYIAVSSDNGLAHHGLILSTICVGGFVCLIAILRFTARLVNVFLTLPKSKENADVTNVRREVFPIDEVGSIFHSLKRIPKSKFVSQFSCSIK